jgi:hypothetical protein
MGRAWQFWLTVFIVTGAMAVMYYSSDYYAERAANGGKSPIAARSAVPQGGKPAQGRPADGGGDPGIIPSNE